MNALIIFTKEPVPGKTKTRLMPYFGPEECAELHKCMLRDIRKEMKYTDSDLIVAYTGGRPDYLKKVFGEKNTLFIEQRGENIGEKMHNAIADAKDLAYDKVVLIGTDIPEIEAETIDAAFTMLDAADIVLGPTEDGGYYLIGMKEPHREAFEVTLYGTGSVYEETVEGIRSAGLTTAAVESYSDIDTREDISAFRRRMREDWHLRHSYTGRYLASKAKVSVIIPVYNEEKTLPHLMSQLSDHRDDCEIIFVDGGSTDSTKDIIKRWIEGNSSGGQACGCLFLESEKSRGIQMNNGALSSTGDILFFLHCDSTIPDRFIDEIRQVMTKRDWGCFGVKFPSKNLFMLTNRLISNHRAAVRHLPFGDQGIFIDRELFFEAGMFPEIPLMEDYEFSLRMRRYGIDPGMTRHRILSSARRYGSGTKSILKTEAQMLRIRSKYRRGADARELLDYYSDIR